ncbi:MAG TPA: hypothetical protein VIJ79_13955 [Acidobacteriaceae bacterium]
MSDKLDLPNSSRKEPLRVIAISAVGAIIGVGLCGALPPALKHGTDDIGRLMLGAIFLCMSAVGLISGLIWLVARMNAARTEK